jgi:hypothetical protein
VRSRPSRVPRVRSVGDVSVAPPRVLGEAAAGDLPDGVVRGLIAAVARGLGAPLPAGEAVPIGDLVAGGDVVAAGEVAPLGGEAEAPALAAPVATPVVVAPVVVVVPVVVLPETPTPTAAPPLTP